MNRPSFGVRLAQQLLFGGVRLLVGARMIGTLPRGGTQIFFANHTSHLDTLTLLAALPDEQRYRTRPVAARDYWCATPARKWVAEKLLNVIFIDRTPKKGQDVLSDVSAALGQGVSIIIFPEGTRHPEAIPKPFRSGLYHLAEAHPDVGLVPVYLENLYRILPKGSFLPVPLINKVIVGEPLARLADEPKSDFLLRAHGYVCALSPVTAS